MYRFLIWAIAIMTLSLSSSYGQRGMDVRPLARGSVTGHMSSGGPRSSILVDTCRKAVWAIIGSQVWRSDDQGRTWSSVSLPDGKPAHGYPSLYSDGCEIMFQWSDLFAANEFRVLQLHGDGWREIDNAEEPWRTTRPSSIAVSSTILIDAVAIADSIQISWDAGTSWQKIPYPMAERSTYEDMLQSPGLGRIAVLRKNQVAEEFHTCCRLVEDAIVPPNTVRYKYLDSSRIIASRIFGKDSSGISCTDDGGQTWYHLSSISFVNRPQTISGNRNNLHARWMDVDTAGACTMILSTGDVISTPDCGRTWYWNGRWEGMGAESGMNRVAALPGGATWFSFPSGIRYLPRRTDTIIHREGLSPRFISIAAIDDQHVIGLTSEAAYYSTDSGRNWYLGAFPTDVLGLSTNKQFGVHPASLERCLYGPDIVTVYAPETGDILQVSGSGVRYVMSAPAYGQYYFKDDDRQFTLRGGALSVFTRHGLTGQRGGFLIRYTDSTGSSVPAPKRTESTTHFIVTPSGDYLVFADSLYHSSDSGKTWRTLDGEGLPRIADMLVPVSSVVIDTVSMVCGLRGCRYMKDDTTVDVPGGIYYSRNQGMTWLPSTMDVDYVPYVWHIMKYSDSILFANVGSVASTLGPEYLDYGQTSMLMSRDDGVSWTTVHRGSTPRRPAIHTGHRMARSADGMLVSLDGHAVIMSADTGRTWSELTSDFSQSTYLNDIAMEGRDVVHVAANDGLYRISIDATSIDVLDPKYRHTSVWAYPNPVQESMTVRVNNLDIVTDGTYRLTLHDMYGTLVEDLTPMIAGSMSPDRREVDYASTALASGVYFIVLRTSVGIERHKFIKVR